jgi:hypothetical protein
MRETPRPFVSAALIVPLPPVNPPENDPPSLTSADTEVNNPACAVAVPAIAKWFVAASQPEKRKANEPATDVANAALF